MAKKDMTADRYFANLDETPVKMAGILFPQGEPKKVPMLWVEAFENNPTFTECEKDKKLTPSECAGLWKKEMKAAHTRRDEWRMNQKAGKKPATNVPPEPKRGE